MEELTFMQYVDKLISGEIECTRDVYDSKDLHDEYLKYMMKPHDVLQTN
jgi:hypothetical protein